VLQLQLANLQRLKQRLCILLHFILLGGHCTLGAFEANNPADNGSKRATQTMAS
jgi:hypothetical protein